MFGVEALETASEDELFEALGNALLGESRDFKSGRSDRARRFGREWFDDRLAGLREEVCGSRSVQTMLRADVGDRMTEIAVVTDAIETLRGHPSATIVAVILVRRGLQALCSLE